MRLNERRVRELFAQPGYKIERFEISKHQKIWATRNGQTQRFIIASSPSDRRALKHIHADLKRGGGRNQ